MNKWRYYYLSQGLMWRINNDETGMFFQTEDEDYAKWLTDILNSGRNYVWDDGIMLTEDGDLVKFETNSGNDVFHPYTGE